MWNVYDRVCCSFPRTSNNAETWNRTINKRIVDAHPNIGKLIETVLEIDDL
jgi:hypothetical protein